MKKRSRKMIKTLLSSKPTCWFLFLAVGWASFCRVWAAVWLKNLFLQIGGVVAVALTAVNDQRAVCFQSVTNAVWVGLPRSLLKAAAPSVWGVRRIHSSAVCSVALLAVGKVEKQMTFLVAGGMHGQVHRFPNSESCLLTSLCILVAGLEDGGNRFKRQTANSFQNIPDWLG